MKQEIHGNTEGIRRTLLEQMKALYQLEMDADAFLPPELSRALAVFTSLMNREIAVYITRDGEIVDVMIGTHQDVELRDYRLRRNSKRLSCVRCIHTHPSASGCLSDVDISALRAFRYDAMTAIGVRDGMPGLVQTAFLGEKIHGENQVLLLDPLRYDRIPQGQWMDRIAEADAAVMRGEDANEREKAERAVLMGIESEEALEELARLAETAGAQVVAGYVQKRDKPDGALFIGRGRAEELARQCQALEADTCIFDEELSGFQVRNLEELLRVKVVDRTMLILDIFAQRASSREGKLQVELAQLNYQSTRLVGEGVALSRLAGGIGTRGPGESKLEIDRRRMRERISALNEQLKELDKTRGVKRERREKSGVPTVAIAGYTNAGKSTLLNYLTNAGILAENKLFATLDPTTRRLSLPGGSEVLLTDTVGFIDRLPTHLVKAFKSTLDEISFSDIIINLVDASESAEERARKSAVTERLLDELGASGKPVITVYNKSDAAVEPEFIPPSAVLISAKNGLGIDALLSELEETVNSGTRTVRMFFPHENASDASELYACSSVKSSEYNDSGVYVTAICDAKTLGRFKRFCVDDAAVQ